MPLAIEAGGDGVQKSGTPPPAIKNEEVLEKGWYVHVREVHGETDDAIALTKAKGGTVWLPKSVIHVVPIRNGRVDIWIDPDFAMEHEKGYEELLGPSGEGDLPEPRHNPEDFEIVVDNPSSKIGNPSYKASYIDHETHKAVALPTKGGDMVWLPKSQIHVERSQEMVKAWIPRWLSKKKPGLHSLK
jgi:hypothetical protein